MYFSQTNFSQTQKPSATPHYILSICLGMIEAWLIFGKDLRKEDKCVKTIHSQ